MLPFSLSCNGFGQTFFHLGPYESTPDQLDKFDPVQQERYYNPADSKQSENNEMDIDLDLSLKLRKLFKSAKWQPISNTTGQLDFFKDVKSSDEKTTFISEPISAEVAELDALIAENQRNSDPKIQERIKEITKNNMALMLRLAETFQPGIEDAMLSSLNRQHMY